MLADHIPFAQAGIPSVALPRCGLPVLNTADDTADRLDPDSLAKTGALVLYFLATEKVTHELNHDDSLREIWMFMVSRRRSLPEQAWIQLSIGRCRRDRNAFNELVRISGQTYAPTLVIGDLFLPDFGPDELEEFLKEHKSTPIPPPAEQASTDLGNAVLRTALTPRSSALCVSAYGGVISAPLEILQVHQVRNRKKQISDDQRRSISLA